MTDEPTGSKRRWRDYRTAAGRRPVKQFLDGLSDRDAAQVVAAMKDVQRSGLTAARAPAGRYPEGRRKAVLLALDGFSKKTQKNPAGQTPARRAASRRLAKPWTVDSISLMRYCLGDRMVGMADDFLDEIVEERSERNAEFPRLVDAALRRRELLRSLAMRREQLGLSQTTVAARMGTSQSSVARLEAGEADARLSTVERFAAALGHTVEWRLGETPRRI